MIEMSDKEFVWQCVLEWQNMTDGWRSPMSKYRRGKRWGWWLLLAWLILLPWWLSDIQNHLEQCIADPPGPSCELPRPQ